MPDRPDPHLYALGLGGNRRHGRHGPPRAVIAAAVTALAAEGLEILARAPLIETPPLGPGARRFANAAILVATPLPPPALLTLVKTLERRFGRRRGRRWGDRVLDIDLLLWSGGRWRARALTLPHKDLAERQFVLTPLRAIAGDWRVPPGGHKVRHLHSRLTRARPLSIERRSACESL